MKDLKKNLIYWGLTFEKLTLAMIFGIVVYVLVMTLMGGGFSEEELKESLLVYTWLFILISVFINGFFAANSYFPMTISLGSTRTVSFTAMQIMQHVILVQYILLSGVAYYFLNREVFDFLATCVLSIIGGIMTLMALSNVTCIISRRFGQVAGMIVYIGSLIIVVAAVVIFIISADSENERFMGRFAIV